MSYNFQKGHQLAREFKEKYDRDHHVCPMCYSDNHTSTYVGYIVNVKEDGTIDESYKDENRVVCSECGWKGITHDLIKELRHTCSWCNKPIEGKVSWCDSDRIEGNGCDYRHTICVSCKDG